MVSILGFHYNGPEFESHPGLDLNLPFFLFSCRTLFSSYPKEAKQLLNGCWLVPPSKCRQNKAQTWENCERTLILKKTWLITRYSTWYSTRGQVTRVWFFKFMTRLCLSLGLNLAIFALTTNIEAGPRFAQIWWQSKVMITEFPRWWISPLDFTWSKVSSILRVPRPDCCRRWLSRGRPCAQSLSLFQGLRPTPSRPKSLELDLDFQ